MGGRPDCLLQVAEVLMVSSILSLVCEEDGTEVDSEEFLTALPDNTVFMGLESGQTWAPHIVRVCMLVKFTKLCHILWNVWQCMAMCLVFSYIDIMGVFQVAG